MILIGRYLFIRMWHVGFVNEWNVVSRRCKFSVAISRQNEIQCRTDNNYMYVMKRNSFSEFAEVRPSGYWYG